MNKLVYLLNSTHLHSNSDGGSTKITLLKHVVNQIIPIQQAEDKTVGKYKHPLSTLWILDSGAFDHIICPTEYFSSFLPVLGVFVQLPNNLTIPVSLKGTMQFNPSIVLKDVLCVPSFSFNLISLSKLALQNSCIVISDAFTPFIQNPVTKMMIRSAKWHKGLYMMDCAPSLPAIALDSISTLSNFVSVSNFVQHHMQFNPKEVSNLL